MPRITPTDWKTLEKIFEADGFKFKRQEGDHRAYIKKGIIRPIKEQANNRSKRVARRCA